jgi:hypothetical protein
MAVAFSSITLAKGRVQNAQVLELIAVMPCIIDIAPDLGAAVRFCHDYICPRRLSTQVLGILGNASAAQVKAISIPTAQHSGVSLGHAIAVMHTGEVQQIHFFIGGVKVLALKALATDAPRAPCPSSTCSLNLRES